MAIKKVNAWIAFDNPTRPLVLTGLGLTILPAIPANCEILHCEKNKLTTLPPLPNCEQLYCNNNQLTSLPQLPKCKFLYCEFNKLTVLPELPVCELVYCYTNELTVIPELPKCHTVLCSNNPLTILPNLPKCEYLECSNNKLTFLPPLPSHKCWYIDCKYNKYLYINKKQAERFNIKETPNYNKHARVIQRCYKNYLRKRYYDVISQYLFKGPTKLVCLFAV